MDSTFTTSSLFSNVVWDRAAPPVGKSASSRTVAGELYTVIKGVPTYLNKWWDHALLEVPAATEGLLAELLDPDREHHLQQVEPFPKRLVWDRVAPFGWEVSFSKHRSSPEISAVLKGSSADLNSWWDHTLFEVTAVREDVFANFLNPGLILNSLRFIQ